MEDQELTESIRMLESLSLNPNNNSDNESDINDYDLIVIRLLLQLKRGNLAALQALESRAREFGDHLLFTAASFLSHNCAKLSRDERQHLRRALDLTLPLLGADLVCAHARIIILLITPQLTSSDAVESEAARYIVSSIASCVGPQTLIDLIVPDVFQLNKQWRLRAIQVLAALSCSSGIASVLPAVVAMCSTSNPGRVRDTGFNTVWEIAVVNGHRIVPHLCELVKIVSAEMKNESNARTVRSAALAIDSLAQAARPYGAQSFGAAAAMVSNCLRVQLERRWVKSAEACAKAAGSMVGLMEEPMRSLYAKELMEVLRGAGLLGDEGLRGVVMGVYKECVCAPGVGGLDVVRWLDGNCAFGSFWARRKELDIESCRMLLDLTVEIAKKIGASEVMKRVNREIDGESWSFRQSLMQIVLKAVAGDAEFEGLVLEMHRLFSSPSVN